MPDHHHPQHTKRHVHLTGTVRVPVAGADAFHLFTPLGERAWSPEWDPQFLAPVQDHSAPGTVFQVAHGDAPITWIVCRRDGERSVQYARWIPTRNAGLVTVTLTPDDGTGSVATVEYELTALTDEGADHLATFASGYEAFLASWETAIAQACAATS